MSNIWSHHPETQVPHESVVGYDVEATDGSIGTVDEAQHDPEDAFLVVDTGHWIFGRKRVIPARLITRIDTDRRTIYLRVSKEHVAGAPDHDVGWRDDQKLREVIAGHYSEA